MTPSDKLEIAKRLYSRAMALSLIESVSWEYLGSQTQQKWLIMADMVIDEVSRITAKK